MLEDQKPRTVDERINIHTWMHAHNHAYTHMSHNVTYTDTDLSLTYSPGDTSDSYSKKMLHIFSHLFNLQLQHLPCEPLSVGPPLLIALII